MTLTREEAKLLVILADAMLQRSAYVACDGKDRPIAHALDKKGLATWMGESWGSKFWAITEKGLLEAENHRK